MSYQQRGLIAFAFIVWSITRSLAVYDSFQHPDKVPVGMDETIAASVSPEFPFYYGNHHHIPPYEPGLELPFRAMWLFGIIPDVTNLHTLQLTLDLGAMSLAIYLGFILAGPWAATVTALCYGSISELATAAAFPWYYYWPIPLSFLFVLLLYKHRQSGGSGWALLAGLELGLWIWFRGSEICLIPSGAVLLWMNRKGLRPIWVFLAGCFISLSPAIVHGIKDAHGIFPRQMIWHSLFIGIGEHPNPWGISFDDGYAFKLAERKYGVPFRTPNYEVVMRTEYLRRLKERPALILSNWIKNTIWGVTAWDAYQFPLWLIHSLWVGMIAAFWLVPPSRPLVLIWLAQCVGVSFVATPSAGYLWETLGLLTLGGSIGWVRLIEKCSTARP